MRGTYTYDPAEFDLGLAAKGVYNGPVPNAWSTLTAIQSRTVLADHYFTESGFTDVFKKNGPGLQRIWKEAGGDSSQPEPSTWS
ncbi:MAG: hypothetical protein IMZ50_01095 [Candidatus Atribacteria bacterium]|nr:hypothetical protein [Candidatus Atribacteria bacterium]